MSKGFAQIYLLIGLIILVLISGVYYLRIRKGAPLTPVCPQDLKQCYDGSYVGRTPGLFNCEFKPCPASDPSTFPDETVNWKTFRAISAEGFGYEMKLPPNWDSAPFVWGEGIEPFPKELAQNIFDKSCGVNKGRITILHFLSSNPQQEIAKAISGLKKDGFTSSSIQTATGTNIEKLTGNLSGQTDYYIYLPSAKGYYYVFGRDECVVNYEKTFDQILSTFKFLDQNQGEYQVTGSTTKDFTTQDEQMLKASLSKLSLSVGLLESFPPGVQIVTKDMNSCEEARKILATLKFVKSFSECRKIEPPQNPSQTVHN